MDVFADRVLPLIRQAEAYRYAGRPELARPLYEQVLELRPDEEFATLGLGNCARDEGDFRTALEWHLRARQLYPQSVWPLVEVAEDYFGLNRLDDAQDAWRAVLEIDPVQFNGLMGLVRLARARGDQEAALAALENIPDPPANLVLERSRLLAGLDRFDEALAVLRDGAAQFPGNPFFLTEAAMIWQERGDLAAARQLLEAAAARDTRSAAPLLKLSDLARQLGEHEAALAYLAQAREERDPEIWVELCAAQVLFELGRYTQSEALLEQAAQTFGPQPLIVKIRAELMARDGRFGEARELITSAARTGKTDAAMVLLEAELAYRAGDTARAAALAAAMHPAPPDLLAGQLFLQASLAEDAWDNGAAALYQLVLQAKPDHRGAISAMVHLAFLAGDLSLAREHLRRLARLEMPGRKARGLSTNISQSFLGQYFDEHAMEPEGMAAILQLREKPVPLRLARLRELAEQMPGWTPAATALLQALRQAGMFAPPPAPASGSPAIPRRIVQYWHGPPPPDVAALMRTWERMHPGWEYRCFDDPAARAWIAANAPAALRAYLRADGPAQRSDVLRLAVLEREGGWYADADDRCLAPLSSLDTGATQFVAYQEEFATLGNNVIGAAPGQKIITLALENAVATLEQGNNDIVWLSTGPGLLSRSFVQAMPGQPAQWPDFLRDVMILSKPALRRAVATHCHASYKFSGGHWADTSFRSGKEKARAKAG